MILELLLLGKKCQQIYVGFVGQKLSEVRFARVLEQGSQALNLLVEIAHEVCATPRRSYKPPYLALALGVRTRP